MIAMHIITHFFPIFGKFPEAVMTKSKRGERRRGQEARAEGGVEVDEEQ